MASQKHSTSHKSSEHYFYEALPLDFLSKGEVEWLPGQDSVFRSQSSLQTGQIAVGQRPFPSIRSAQFGFESLTLTSKSDHNSYVLWLPGQDSNLNSETQILECYHYTTGQYESVLRNHYPAELILCMRRDPASSL